MLFPTVQFAIFFPLTLALNWALMPRPKFWKPFIVVASYAFYAAANWRFCFLLGGITLWNQGAARLIHASDDERRRKLVVGFAVAGNLIVLGVFKYYSFFVQDVDRVLDAMRLGLPLPLLTVALPVGVSFFTFQAISYTVDVHRRLIAPASLLDAAIYLSFFPHLVAGPIVRAREFLPQLTTPRDPERVALGAGVSLIALGLIKKVVIADYLARTVVDPVFAVPQAYAAPDVALAAYAYTAQIYCDFSGYTDIAIGLALLMGFVFPQNFDRPYRSLGVREFWRRWHMTLSRFLRDFLYIPLGGNRGTRWFVYRNLMITMLLGGLWHGAAWNFVVWGGLHGTLLALERLLGKRAPYGWLPAPARVALTFLLVLVGWVFFRAPDLHAAVRYLASMAGLGSAQQGAALVAGLVYQPYYLLTAATAALITWTCPQTWDWTRTLTLPKAATAVALFVVAAVVLMTQAYNPFIYFIF